jgi:hypothetical protein
MGSGADFFESAAAVVMSSSVTCSHRLIKEKSGSPGFKDLERISVFATSQYTGRGFPSPLSSKGPEEQLQHFGSIANLGRASVQDLLPFLSRDRPRS